MTALDWSDRFWRKVHPEALSGCWLWHGATSASGYGDYYLNSKSHRAHRIAYELTRGPVPAGLFVCHKCDVRSCVNPDHLFLGTHRENMADMHAKGRGVAVGGARNGRHTKPEATARGERHGFAKFTLAQVVEIRARLAGGETQRGLARVLGVNGSTIRCIALGRTWKAGAA